MRATNLTPWPPDPVPDDIWAWAIELAGIAYRNPTGWSSESIDDYARGSDAERRTAILTEARTAYGGSGSPRYSFPAPDWHWNTVPALDPLTD